MSKIAEELSVARTNKEQIEENTLAMNWTNLRGKSCSKSLAKNTN